MFFKVITALGIAAMLVKLGIIFIPPIRASRGLSADENYNPNDYSL